ncbi:MAG: hypothetical protein AAFZ07_26240 [Actinomycetota bacterium]
MSRFTEGLERQLGQIADRATPSFTAWEAIRQRVAEQANEPEMEVVMLTTDPSPEQLRVRRRYLVAVALVGLVLLGGLVALAAGRDGSESVPVTRPPTETEEQPLQGGVLGPGRYETDLLGMSMTYSVDRDWRVARASAAQVGLAPPDSERRFVQFMRLGGWFSGSEATDPLYGGEGSIEPSDIDGWIASNDVIATPLPDVRLDDGTLRVVDVQIDPASDADELFTHSISAESVLGAPRYQFPLRADERARFWLLPVESYDPILITATAPIGDASFLDDVADLVSTIDVGPPAPPPPPR